MALQMSQIRQSFVANIASGRLGQLAAIDRYAMVFPSMSIELDLLVETLVAHIAFIGQNTAMRSFVVHQTELEFVGFRAFVALVERLIAVASHVHFQLRVCTVLLAARIALELFVVSLNV